MTTRVLPTIAAVLLTATVNAVPAIAAGHTGLETAQEQTCIAIAMPSAKGVDDATAFGTSLRELFMSYLTGPTLRAVALEARLASQAIEEARTKECAFVLLTSVTRVRNEGGGVGRALGRAAGAAASYGVPYGGTAVSSAARGAAVAGAYAISNAAETTKARDEITLDYRIATVDKIANAQPKSQKAKAKNDGEDLLTPLVETASEAIAAAVAKK